MPDDRERCKERVFPNERWGAFHPHRCNRFAVKDGFCNQHHPETIKAREEEKERRYKERYENSPVRLLQKAFGEIQLLKEENERLKSELERLKNANRKTD